MTSRIKVGDTVRINEKYNEILNNRYARGDVKKGNQVGTEFKVTAVGHDFDYYAAGDPNGWGVLEEYLDVVKSAEADRPEKVEKTTAAIGALGKELDTLLGIVGVSEKTHRHLVDLLDEVVDAIQEERA